MNIITIIGFVSAVISLSAIFIPEKWRSKKLVFISFIILTTILSSVIVNQHSKLSRIKTVSAAASELVKEKGMNFTQRGFVQASLAFMEQNKDLYPDSYERAKDINEKLKKSIFGSDEVDAASELEGLLNGIAILNRY